MQILLANAKIMYDKSIIKPQTIPHFQPIANELAKEMSRLDIDTLSKELDCSRALALGTYKRYQDFFHAEKMPAIMAYNESFVYEGFEYREDYGEELYPHFIREI